jgi:hypothetical protein
MIRFLPDGITGFVERVRARRQEGGA